MTKPQVIQLIAERLNVSKKQATDFVKEFLGIITDAMQANDTVEFTKFGTFKTVKAAERNGVNPKTGEKITIPAKMRVKFTASKKLLITD